MRIFVLNGCNFGLYQEVAYLLSIIPTINDNYGEDFVYLIRRFKDNTLKIGTTKDIYKRMECIKGEIRKESGDYDETIIVESVFLGGYKEEQYMHKKFSSLNCGYQGRTKKEWFKNDKLIHNEFFKLWKHCVGIEDYKH